MQRAREKDRQMNETFREEVEGSVGSAQEDFKPYGSSSQRRIFYQLRYVRLIIVYKRVEHAHTKDRFGHQNAHENRKS
ncbi:hypothetical protein NECAME_15080 [Necator americanus]|uniref:Uncharacterized protein n=1 Tax=Necator americanus TaxID=51031 RepID=W2SJP9_NECAM|nr:hypothetical protein NECAME_15080 [Necator americanus]ETN69820.1 hypothetical protein NECAME_15080 [Necator americanus]